MTVEQIKAGMGINRDSGWKLRYEPVMLNGG